MTKLYARETVTPASIYSCRAANTRAMRTHTNARPTKRTRSKSCVLDLCLRIWLARPKNCSPTIEFPAEAAHRLLGVHALSSLIHRHIILSSAHLTSRKGIETWKPQCVSKLPFSTLWLDWLFHYRKTTILSGKYLSKFVIVTRAKRFCFSFIHSFILWNANRRWQTCYYVCGENHFFFFTLLLLLPPSLLLLLLSHQNLKHTYTTSMSESKGQQQ